MAESEEALKSLLMKVKEESEKTGIKFKIQKTKIMVFGPITLYQIDGEEMETGSKITAMVTTTMKWGTLFRTKRWTTDWEKLFPKHTSEKGSVLKLYQTAP